MSRTGSILLFLAMGSMAAGAETTELAPGVTLLPGHFVPGTQPDGNTIIFSAPDGLIVMDTGRHAKHTQAIIDFATESGRQVKAIINSHWHLDHIGGNPKLRTQFPGVRVYASNALEGALTGFLANYKSQLEGMLEDPATDAGTRKTLSAEIAIIESGPTLAPDEVITGTGNKTIAGKTLLIGLEAHAATAGDVWVFDKDSGILASGDLVTLPGPFLDTACPAGWKTALEHLAKQDFQQLIPGHGPPMTRDQFEQYRGAFGNLVACAATDKASEDCIDGWLKDVGALVPEPDQEFTRSLVDYYVTNVLRGDPGKLAKLCDG